MYRLDEELDRLESHARTRALDPAERLGNPAVWAAGIAGIAVIIAAILVAWAIRTPASSAGVTMILATDSAQHPAVLPVTSVTLRLPPFEAGRACDDSRYAIGETDRAMLLEQMRRYVCQSAALDQVLVIGGHDHRELTGAARKRYGSNSALATARSECAIQMIDKLLEDSLPRCPPLAERPHRSLIAVPRATHRDASADELAADRRVWIILTSDADG